MGNSPFRGMWDGLNVNPIEYVTGTYLHIISMHLVNLALRSIGLFMHWSVPLLFFSAASAMASLNHTRHDIRFLAPFFFDVRDHSVHHAWPRSNYGQFTMWWDRFYGCYISYEDFKLRRSKGTLRRSFEATSDRGGRDGSAMQPHTDALL